MGIVETVFPYLRMRNAAKAIEFYKDVFGAKETARLTDPTGRIGHAQLSLGGITIMLSDEHPEMGVYGPEKFGGTGSLLHLHVQGLDEMHKKALAAGARETMAPKDQFYGERASKFVDPFGHEWMLGQHIEVMSFEEMQQRYDAMCAGKAES